MRGRLATVLALLAASAAAPPAASAQAPVRDPIPEQPIQSGIGLQLKELARLPASETYPGPPVDQRLVRWNRINYLGELPDGSGRMYVPDLNGKLYLVEHGRRTSTSTSAPPSRRPSSRRSGLGQGFGFVAFHPDFERNGRFYTVHTEQASLATRHAGPDARAAHHLPRRHHRVDGGRPAARTRSTAPTARCCGSASAARSTASSRSTSTRARSRTIADYGLLYLAAGDGGIGVSTDDPAAPRPARRASCCGSTRAATTAPNGRYGIPSRQPVRPAGPARSARSTRSASATRYRFSWDPARTSRLFLGHIGEHADRGRLRGPRAAPTSAGATARARSCSTRRRRTRATGSSRCRPTTRSTATPTRWPRTTTTRRRTGTAPRTSGTRIVGGFVYRGRNVPELRGKYVFADLVDRAHLLHRGRPDAQRPPARPDPPAHALRPGRPAGHSQQILNADGKGDPNRVDPRFGIDADGELYLLSKANGKIFKITGTRRFAACDVGHTRVEHATARRGLGAGHAVEVAVRGRRGDPHRARRRAPRPAPPVRVRGPDQGPGSSATSRSTPTSASTRRWRSPTVT